MKYVPVRISDLVDSINKDLYLPAIQRELVWSYNGVERLFDSIMSDFPIGSFLYWKLDQANKNKWPIYEFIRDYNEEKPHNPIACMHGVTQDIFLVLDGQQRISSLFIGLRGSYRYFYYRWRETRLYIDLLKHPQADGDEKSPEDLTYGFCFRENSEQYGEQEQLWYEVGRILDFKEAEDAKEDMSQELAELSVEQKRIANRIIGRLHNRIHTTLIGNYYVEQSQNYDKVLQIFVRANSAGKPLEYSDLLLSTATAKWDKLDARKEIHTFTDDLNDIGGKFNFGKDFVLKACLYLCESLDIQYKLGNFTMSNLRIIENNWENIKRYLSTTVRLISRFGFNSKNIMAQNALLPIAFYLMKRENAKFDSSSARDDVEAQEAIRKWFVFATLKGAFGGSSDTTLSRLRELLKPLGISDKFPSDHLYRSLEIEPSWNEDEIEYLLESCTSNARITNLVLSILYPDKHWHDTVFHIDHIFPKAEFTSKALKQRNYDEKKRDRYRSQYDLLCNLQLLPELENLRKSDQSFGVWLNTRDESFRCRHLIPDMQNYSLDVFLEFIEARKALITSKLKALVSLN